MQHKLLINGELVSGEGEKQPVYNPATGDVLLEIAEASAEQVDAAVRAADAAFAEWGQTTPKVRAECLLKLADVIEENGQVFAELESRNCGKPLHSAFNDEIPAIVDVFRFIAGAARCLNGLAAGEYLEGHTSMIRRDPLGVVASIAPWNYPLMMAAWKLAPALPGIVTGLALLTAFKTINLEPGFFTIVVGHATFCVVVVFNNVIARFRRTSWSLVEASMDLGANGWQTFRYVVLPNLSSALLAGGMLAFALSFDEIIVTTFTAGHERTLPLWLLNQLGRPRDVPVTNVVALLVMLVTTLPILGAWWLTREGDNGQ